MGAVLECGTNSWFMWHQDACRNSGVAQCASSSLESAYKQAGAWVSYRRLNFQQLMYFRQLLKQLPKPGKGEVVVVDPKGKTLVTVKANAHSGTDGIH